MDNKLVGISSAVLALGLASGFTLARMSGPDTPGAGPATQVAPTVPAAADNAPSVPRPGLPDSDATEPTLSVDDGARRSAPEPAPGAQVAIADTEEPRDGAAAALALEALDIAQRNRLALRDLRATLETERSAHRQSREALDTARVVLKSLQDEVAEMREQYADDESRRAPRRGPQDVNTEVLVAGGYSDQEATYLARRWGEEAMLRLYTRDQARRENWSDERYNTEMRNLRRGEGSLRDELGDSGYDQLLFSAGRGNRLAVQSVIEGSPAQFVGLNSGDVIVRYDGARIFGVDDLRARTSAGVPDEPVRVEVQRGAEIIEYEIPRGPLGIMTQTQTIQP